MDTKNKPQSFLIFEPFMVIYVFTDTAAPVFGAQVGQTHS